MFKVFIREQYNLWPLTSMLVQSGIKTNLNFDILYWNTADTEKMGIVIKNLLNNPRRREDIAPVFLSYWPEGWQCFWQTVSLCYPSAVAMKVCNFVAGLAKARKKLQQSKNYPWHSF
jgi:hypothetical protein